MIICQFEKYHIPLNFYELHINVGDLMCHTLCSREYKRTSLFVNLKKIHIPLQFYELQVQKNFTFVRLNKYVRLKVVSRKHVANLMKN